jgi:hypothetical protein
LTENSTVEIPKTFTATTSVTMPYPVSNTQDEATMLHKIIRQENASTHCANLLANSLRHDLFQPERFSRCNPFANKAHKLSACVPSTKISKSGEVTRPFALNDFYLSPSLHSFKT